MTGGSLAMAKDGEMEHGDVKLGTKIIRYWKENQYEFVRRCRLPDLVKTHTEFIGCANMLREEITSYLKEGQSEFLDRRRLHHVAKKRSDLFGSVKY